MFTADAATQSDAFPPLELINQLLRQQSMHIFAQTQHHQNDAVVQARAFSWVVIDFHRFSSNFHKFSGPCWAQPSQGHFWSSGGWRWLILNILGASGHGNVHIYIVNCSVQKTRVFFCIFLHRGSIAKMILSCKREHDFASPRYEKWWSFTSQASHFGPLV